MLGRSKVPKKWEATTARTDSKEEEVTDEESRQRGNEQGVRH